MVRTGSNMLRLLLRKTGIPTTTLPFWLMMSRRRSAGSLWLHLAIPLLRFTQLVPRPVCIQFTPLQCPSDSVTHRSHQRAMVLFICAPKDLTYSLRQQLRNIGVFIGD
eukprot:3457852-Amphidinium_carterae.1